MDVPRMTNPDGGSEKTHMPGATAKDKRRIWFERRVLGHPQSGRSSGGWFVACWVPRKRFGQRRHRCSEECEQFMAFHGPAAGCVCQRHVSAERVYLRRDWDFSTDLYLSVFLTQTQKRWWEVRSGATRTGEPSEEDESVPCLPASCRSFLSSPLWDRLTVRVGLIGLRSHTHSFASCRPGLLTGDWSIKASISRTDEPDNGAYTDLFRVRSWFKEGGLPLEHTFEGNSTYIHISMLPSLFSTPIAIHTYSFPSPSYSLCFSIPSWGKIPFSMTS